MPCKNCGSHEAGKTRCVVCEAKWCKDCLGTYAEKRSSGWKCNECVGTASKQSYAPSEPKMLKCCECNRDVEKGSRCYFCGNYTYW